MPSERPCDGLLEGCMGALCAGFSRGSTGFTKGSGTF